jgi:hypothetical protein
MASKAENVTFPFSLDGTSNTPVRYFDCNSTSQASALPPEWYGKFVILTNDSANAAQFFLSCNASASCDETLAAAAAGQASPNLGGVILGNFSRQGRLPYPTNDATGKPRTLYLVRASVSAATLRLELSEQ